MDLKRACKAAGLAWTLGVCSFVAGYLLPTSNPDLVANMVLFCVVPLSLSLPAAGCGSVARNEVESLTQIGRG